MKVRVSQKEVDELLGKKCSSKTLKPKKIMDLKKIQRETDLISRQVDLLVSKIERALKE